MKRVISGVIAAVVLALLVVPVGVTVVDGQVRVEPARVQAAAPAIDKCVKIALPIFAGDNKCVDNDPAKGGALIVYLRRLLLLLSGAVGLVVVTMIVLGGVQYITSTADPARVKAGKERIQNALIALVLYLMMFAILSFLIPGGILG